MLAPTMLCLLSAALTPPSFTRHDSIEPNRLEPRRGRRELCAAALLAWPASAARAATVTGDTSRRCQTVSNPSSTVVTCLGFGLDKEARLRGCAADESCISSSAVKNPSKFAPPWQPPKVTPEAKDAERAWRALVAAVEEQPGLTIVERDTPRFYLRAQAASQVPPDGTDDVEFRLLDELPPRALFRSSTRQSVFVYPLQQPVPNQKSHAERLEAIRTTLGWDTVGGLGGDSALERELGGRQVRNFFGLQLQGVAVPDYEEDY